MVAPELPSLAFHPTLLVPFPRRAELRFESPVRAESDEPHRLLPLMAAQDFLYRTPQIVVAQHAEDSAKIGECQLVRFQERLLVGMRIGSMKGASARHAAHAELVGLAPLPVELHPSFIPVHLPFAAPSVRLRHKSLPPQQTHGGSSFTHVPSHRGFGYLHFCPLPTQSRKDAVRGVPLLARRLAVALQDPIDKGDRRRQP